MKNELTYDQMRLLFARIPAIETDRLLLRRLRMSDLRDMYAYASDPAVAEHVLWHAHTSLSDTKVQLRGAIRQYRRGDPSSWAIMLKSTGHMVGTIGFMWVNAEHQTGEIGYSLARSCWNQGLMTEAVQAVLGFAFDRLGLNRVEAQHETTNPASGRVMQKCGMRLEGILRDRVRNKGVYRDTALYSILKSEYNNHAADSSPSSPVAE